MAHNVYNHTFVSTHNINRNNIIYIYVLYKWYYIILKEKNAQEARTDTKWFCVGWEDSGEGQLDIYFSIINNFESACMAPEIPFTQEILLDRIFY